MQNVQPLRPICRRKASRFDAGDGVWAYWTAPKTDDVSPIRDLSAGGLFLATDKPTSEGAKLKMEFLVPEGQIRVEAEVRHFEPNHGLGLKFTAIGEQDRRRMVALLARVRSNSLEPRKRQFTGIAQT